MTTYKITWKTAEGFSDQWETTNEKAANVFMEALIARGLFPFVSAVKRKAS